MWRGAGVLGRETVAQSTVHFCWPGLCSIPTSWVTWTMLPEVSVHWVPHLSKEIVHAFFLGMVWGWREVGLSNSYGRPNIQRALNDYWLISSWAGSNTFPLCNLASLGSQGQDSVWSQRDFTYRLFLILVLIQITRNRAVFCRRPVIWICYNPLSHRTEDTLPLIIWIQRQVGLIGLTDNTYDWELWVINYSLPQNSMSIT